MLHKFTVFDSRLCYWYVGLSRVASQKPKTLAYSTNNHRFVITLTEGDDLIF